MQKYDSYLQPQPIRSFCSKDCFIEEPTNFVFAQEFNQMYRNIMNLSTFLIVCSQFLLKMNFCYDLWEIEAEDSPFRILDSRFDSQCFADLQFSAPIIQNAEATNVNLSPHQQRHQQLSKPGVCSEKNECNFSESYQRKSDALQTNETRKTLKNRKKRIIKPSPYHNYQKHLNSTLKQLIRLPQLDLCRPRYHSIAHDLWSVFRESTLSTKKILHFIFNEFNQYKITHKQLVELGFAGIYEGSTFQELSEAKHYLTELVLSQLNQHNIDNYLSFRRIRNQIKFKKYLLLFRQELEDGFLKKRFTNRSRKEQIKKQMCRECSK